MHLKASQIKGLAVIDFSRVYLGALHAAIIDPDSGRILAYQLKKHRENLISPIDVRAWHVDSLELSDGYELHQRSDLIRVDQVLASGKTFLGKKVRTESGHQLGICLDYELDLDAGRLYHIEVGRQYLSFFSFQRRLIGWQSILEVRPRLIIVKDSALKLPILNREAVAKAAGLRGRAIAA